MSLFRRVGVGCWVLCFDEVLLSNIRLLVPFCLRTALFDHAVFAVFRIPYPLSSPPSLYWFQSAATMLPAITVIVAVYFQPLLLPKSGSSA